MRRILTSSLLFVATACLASAGAQGPAAEVKRTIPRARFGDVVVTRNVSYGEDPRLHALDVYRPRLLPRGPLPAVVFMHGGGWSEGDKGDHPKKGTFFARQGFVYVTINYRLSPAVKHPAHVQDAARAVAWTHRNIAAYGGDPSRIFLIGHSAGAHLAALVATAPRFLREHGLGPEIIRGVVLLDGSGYDLAERLPTSRGWMRQMLVGAFGEDAETWKDASPVHQIDPANPLPPFKLFHITRRKASVRQARALGQKLVLAGATVQIVQVPDRTHVSINRLLGSPGDVVTKKILRFFRRHGGT